MYPEKENTGMSKDRWEYWHNFIWRPIEGTVYSKNIRLKYSSGASQYIEYSQPMRIFIDLDGSLYPGVVFVENQKHDKDILNMRVLYVYHKIGKTVECNTIRYTLGNTANDWQVSDVEVVDSQYIRYRPEQDYGLGWPYAERSC